jgi:hypothetical protein
LLKQVIGLDENWLPQPAPSPAATSSFAGQPMALSFGWHPPHIPTPPIHVPPIHIPPIHLPDLTEGWKRRARDLAWRTAAQVDAAQGSSTYCPRNEIQAALLALAATFAIGTPTPESRFMGAVISTIAFTLPDEYCRQSGR